MLARFSFRACNYYFLNLAWLPNIIINIYLGFQSSNVTEITDEEKLLDSDSEVTRRLRFEAVLKLQEENSGLIEPKKSDVIVPGMFLRRPIAPPSVLSNKEPTSEQQQRDPINFSETSSSSSPNRTSTSDHRNIGMRRHRARNSRKPVKQWVKKDSNPTN